MRSPHSVAFRLAIKLVIDEVKHEHKLSYPSWLFYSPFTMVFSAPKPSVHVNR